MSHMHTSIILHGPNHNLNNKAAYDLAAHFVSQDSLHTSTPSDGEINLAIQHISDRVHPSVFVTDDLSIETMRNMQEFLAQKPLIGSNKCAIIPNCDSILKSAANSCLKVIEEPGENNLIIITTRSLASLLATIRSRCYKVYIKDDTQNINSFADENQYISSRYSAIDYTFLTRFTDFIKREDAKQHRSIDNINTGKILESIKAMDENNLELVPDIILSYLEFKIHNEPDNSVIYAKRALKINSITRNSQSQDQHYLALLCILYCIGC